MSFAPGKIRLLLVCSLVGVATVLAFQNCGKAGFEQTGTLDGGALTQSSASTDPRIASEPFPIEAELNLISYMSCPMAGASTIKDPSDISNPFYNIRAGSFDNVAYASQFGLTSLSTEEQYRRLRGGIGLKQDFISHIKTKYQRDDQQILTQTLTGHPAVQNMKPTLALIYDDRSRGTGGFGFDYTLLTPMMDSLTNPSMATYLAKAQKNGTSGNMKQSFFSGLDPAQRAMLGSISWGKSETDRDTLASRLGGSLTLTLGYANASFATDITALASPTGDQYKTVYGRGYRFMMSTQAHHAATETSYHTARKSYFLANIEELNMETKPVSVINSGGTAGLDTGRTWDCFSLAVVRDIDRLDPYTQRPMTTCRDPLTNQPISARTSGICDTKTANNTIIYGVRRICPTQTITSLNSNSLAMQRLAMARRVLPAENWEINTDSNHLCAVPTPAAFARGKCYSSGDEDPTKYIQYNTQTQNCGSTGNECPAYVSICYRTK